MAKKRVITSNMQGDSDALFVRVALEDCSSGDVVLVEESCTAILIKNGQMQQTLNAGKHSLLSYGTTKDTFDVVFLPKTTKIKMLWGTKEQFSFRDPVEDVSLRVGANGEIDVQIVSPRKFFLELGKQKQVFKVADLKENIQNKLISYIEQFTAVYMREQKMSYDRLDENKTFVAREIKPFVSNEMEKDFGIRIASLTINGVIIPQQFLEALAAAKAQRLGLTKQKVQELMEEEKRKQQLMNQQTLEQMAAERVDAHNMVEKEAVAQTVTEQVQTERPQQEQRTQEKTENEQEQDGMLLL